MSNLVFPSFAGLTWDKEIKVSFNTIIQSSVSGKEIRIALISSPIYEFNLTFDFLRNKPNATEWKTLYNFYLTHKGSFESFLFEYAEDNTANNQFIGLGTGNKTQFQLLRGLGNDFAEPVQNLKTLTDIKINGSIVSSSNYTLTSSGIIIFNTPPSNGALITWSGSFYYRARFTDDELSLTQFCKCFFKGSLSITANLGNKI